MCSRPEKPIEAFGEHPVAMPDAIAVDQGLFRKTIGCFATGVAIVTTKSHGELYGMTVNSLVSVSMHPRLILVCLANGARTISGVQARGWFVVHILQEGQAALCNRFARPGKDHFACADFIFNEYDLPVLLGCLAYLVCRLEHIIMEGDHVIVVGEVCKVEFGEGAPLVFFRGAYHSMSTKAMFEDVNLNWYW